MDNNVYKWVKASDELPEFENQYFVRVPALSFLKGIADFNGKHFEGNFINQFSRKDFEWLKEIKAITQSPLSVQNNEDDPSSARKREFAKMIKRVESLRKLARHLRKENTELKNSSPLSVDSRDEENDLIVKEIQSFIDATDNPMLIKGLHEAKLIVERHQNKKP